MSPDAPRRLTFRWEINLGHVLTAIMLLSSMIGMFVSMNNRILIVEVKIPVLEKNVDALLTGQKIALDAQIVMGRTLDRLTFLVEEVRQGKK